MSWEATDNIGLDSIQIYYSNDNGSNFLLMGSVGASLDGFSFVIPPGVSESALVKLIVKDFTGNEGEGISETFAVADNTPPSISIESPISGTTVGIGNFCTLSWTAYDNVGIVDADLLYKTSDSWVIISENMGDINTYNWLIPNEPTDNLQIKIIVFDAVGLNDTAAVEGIAIQIEYPKIISVFPDTDKIPFSLNEITFGFSQQLDPSTISSENILVNSNQFDYSNLSLTYIDSIQQIRIQFLNGLKSLDTLSLYLDHNISNIYGYQLDGDGDEMGGDSYDDTLYTTMLGDFNNDYSIGLEDLATFVNALDNDLYEYELGPFSGEIPHVHVTPDTKYNIEDIVGFVMMWNWYFSNNSLTFTNYEDNGALILMEAQHDTIYFDLPEDLSAYEIQIKYNPVSFFIGQKDDNSSLFLNHIDPEIGLYTIMAAPNQREVAIPVEIRGQNANISVSYKGITGTGEIAGQMTRNMTIENIPDEFVLYPNYPNPFNPSTKIDYGLPEASNVKLMIYDILGRQVKTLVNELQDPGYKSVTWHGKDQMGRKVGAGMYFYLINAGKNKQIKKMMLLK